MNEPKSLDPECVALAFRGLFDAMLDRDAEATTYARDVKALLNMLLSGIGDLKSESHHRADQLGDCKNKIEAIRNVYLKHDPGKGFASIDEWKLAMEALLTTSDPE